MGPAPAWRSRLAPTAGPARWSAVCPALAAPSRRQSCIRLLLARPSGRGGSRTARSAQRAWVDGKAAEALAQLPAIEARRLAATDAYALALGGDLAGQPLVRYPVLVPAGVDAAAVVTRALRAQGIYAGTWYRPALFPGVADPATYNYEPGTLPVTEDVIARIVNLPTDVTPERAREIAAAYLLLSR